MKSKNNKISEKYYFHFGKRERNKDYERNIGELLSEITYVKLRALGNVKTMYTLNKCMHQHFTGN